MLRSYILCNVSHIYHNKCSKDTAISNVLASCVQTIEHDKPSTSSPTPSSHSPYRFPYPDISSPYSSSPSPSPSRPFSRHCNSPPPCNSITISSPLLSANTVILFDGEP